VRFVVRFVGRFVFSCLLSLFRCSGLLFCLWLVLFNMFTIPPLRGVHPPSGYVPLSGGSASPVGREHSSVHVLRPRRAHPVKHPVYQTLPTPAHTNTQATKTRQAHKTPPVKAPHRDPTKPKIGDGAATSNQQTKQTQNNQTQNSHPKNKHSTDPTRAGQEEHEVKRQPNHTQKWGTASKPETTTKRNRAEPKTNATNKQKTSHRVGWGRGNCSAGWVWGFSGHSFGRFPGL